VENGHVDSETPARASFSSSYYYFIFISINQRDRNWPSDDVSVDPWVDLTSIDCSE
jgi:hypothetical protein